MPRGLRSPDGATACSADTAAAAAATVALASALTAYTDGNGVVPPTKATAGAGGPAKSDPMRSNSAASVIVMRASLIIRPIRQR